MTRNICVHHFALASALAVLVCACKLPIDGLDAGFDDEADDTDEADDSNEGNDTSDNDDETLECLVGTLPTAVGVSQSVWETSCEVVCAEGWGHDGEQLPIAWTTSVTDPIGQAVFQARALGMLENGHLVVAIESDHGLDLQFFEPDGVGYGGYTAPDIRSHLFGVEIAENRLYAIHGDDDGVVVASAVDLGSQQQLWAKEFAGAAGGSVAHGPANVAFILEPDAEQSGRELVMLDLDGGPQWTTPTVDFAGSLAFSPSGDRVAVAGEIIRLYATDDGALLDEIVHAEPTLSTGVVGFVGDDRLVTVGTSYADAPLQGWLASDSLVGEGDWELLYNRASAWCPTPADDWATGEWLSSVAALPDGTVIVAGQEGYKREDADEDGAFGSNPWVAHVTADGEFLASDRGLWDGAATDTVSAADGSVFVLSVNLPDPGELAGFRLRKYVP